MQYTNGLVTINVDLSLPLNRKNTERVEKMMKEYAESIADFIDFCAGIQSGDDYMNETPLGHQLEEG